MKLTLFSHSLAVLLALMTLQVQAAGKVVALAGTADLERSDGSIVALTMQQSVVIGEKIVTQSDGNVKVLLDDDSVLTIGPDTTIVINQNSVNNNQSQTEINVRKGWLRSVVAKKLHSNSYYRVVTPTAVAGVKGTDFKTHVFNATTTAFQTFQGLVSVATLGNLQQTALLPPNTFSIVRHNTKPTQAVKIAPNESLTKRVRQKLQQMGDSLDNGNDSEKPDTKPSDQPSPDVGSPEADIPSSSGSEKPSKSVSTALDRVGVADKSDKPEVSMNAVEQRLVNSIVEKIEIEIAPTAPAIAEQIMAPVVPQQRIVNEAATAKVSTATTTEKPTPPPPVTVPQTSITAPVITDPSLLKPKAVQLPIRIQIPTLPSR